MILDILENAHRYLALSKDFAKAFEFLSHPDLKELPVGKYEIDGDRIYAMVSEDCGRKKEDALLETHEKYIDIQLVLAGTDTMGWKPKSLCSQPVQAKNPMYSSLLTRLIPGSQQKAEPLQSSFRKTHTCH